MANCSKCDTPLTYGDIFCPECGAKVLIPTIDSQDRKQKKQNIPKREPVPLQQHRISTREIKRGGVTPPGHRPSASLIKMFEIGIFCVSLVVVGVIFLIIGEFFWAAGLAMLGALFFCLLYSKPKYAQQRPDEINPIPLRQQGEVVDVKAHDLETRKLDGSSPAARGLREGVVEELVEEQTEQDATHADIKDTIVLPLLIALIPIFLLIIFVIVVWPLKLWAGTFSVLMMLFTGNLSIIIMRDILRKEEEEEKLLKVDKGKDITTTCLVTVGILVLLTLMAPILGAVVGSAKGALQIFLMVFLFFLITSAGTISTIIFQAMLMRRKFIKT